MRWRHYILAAGLFLAVALATVAIQVEGIQAGYRLDRAIQQLQQTQQQLDALDLELQNARSPEAVRTFFRSRLAGDQAASPVASFPSARRAPLYSYASAVPANPVFPGAAPVRAGQGAP